MDINHLLMQQTTVQTHYYVIYGIIIVNILALVGLTIVCCNKKMFWEGPHRNLVCQTPMGSPNNNNSNAITEHGNIPNDINNEYTSTSESEE